MLAWDPSLAIGIPAVDAQHVALFEHVARFEAAVEGGERGAALERLFGFLADYVRAHFEAEERLMREVSYPGIYDHVREHVDFSHRLRLLVPLWNEEGDSSAVLSVLVGFVRSWLVEHVGSTDRRVGEFLRGRGGPPELR